MLVPKSFGLKNSSVQKNFPETSLNFPEDTLETSLTFKIILQAPKTLIKKRGQLDERINLVTTSLLELLIAAKKRP